MAHYLQKCGLKSESLVGLSVERSPEMVTALLAILKAGCAYVPLNPDYPPERLDYVIQDAETLNPVIKLYIDKHNTPITSNFKLNRQSSGTSAHS
ncbi:AMP-binding protein [Microcystis aeruginosa CS-552/01]|nr:AMP-binding protein [Microcystis aeruginosa]MDB9412457.1 AMP-binding protein [Microcystis aeruginosa CS-567/02]MDB9432550.1 AMP-binding protein [Microcystis aeruginosa CS-552/01]